MSLAPGTLLNNRYRIVSILGQGGMGFVYRATDEILNVDVAVKENLYLADEYTRQFQREASILANLRHPNMPRVGDYYCVTGQGQYLVMDYIEGEDLRQRIERIGSLPEREVILIGAIICDALTYLHTRQPAIIHRDIKPGNIKITPEGEVFLVDFGLAKVSEGTQATITGARAMTPGYSPPEQYGTARTDARSDIYSLSATLYAALTGSIPEDGLSRLTGQAQLTPLRRLQPTVNRRLSSVIEKGLSIDTESRHQTAEDYKSLLVESGEMTHLIRPRPIVAPPPENEMLANKTLDTNQDIPPNKPGNKIDLILNTIINGKAVIWAPIILTILLASIFFLRTKSPNNNLTPMLNGTNIQTPTTASITQVFIEVTQVITPTRKTDLSTPSPIPSITPKLTKTIVSSQEAPPVLAPIGGGADEITFASDRSGTMQLWAMKVDGSFQKQLTTIEGGACQPDWTKDGKHLAFISPCSSKNDIYTGSRIHSMKADDSKFSPLAVPPPYAGDFDPAWSPDGKRIAFTSVRTEIRHIFVFNLEDSTLQELSNTEFPDKQPAWDPGGKQIAFSRQESISRIWIMYDNGRSASLFTKSGYVNNNMPAWSPDGEFLIYSQTEANGTVAWLVSKRYEDRGTSNEKRINVKNWNLGSFPVSRTHFSPDGKYIVFESWPDGRNHDIYIMDLKTNEISRLTTDPEFDFTPTWRPKLTNQ